MIKKIKDNFLFWLHDVIERQNKAIDDLEWLRSYVGGSGKESEKLRAFYNRRTCFPKLKKALAERWVEVLGGQNHEQEKP